MSNTVMNDIIAADEALDLLFELGCEELPAGPLTTMAEALHQGICQGLTDRGLSFASAAWFATPRRLAVLVSGLVPRAPDRETEILGPPVAAATDKDGNWTPAAQGFARKQGVTVDELQQIETDKGLRLGLTRTEPGAIAADALPELISDAVAGIPVAKRMRWGRERHEFLRPVQWLVALLGDQVLPVTLFGLKAGDTSPGHRFHHPDLVSLKAPSDYLAAMRAANVVVDYQERRELIRNQVEAVAREVNGVPVIGDDLLDEVTGLVEWPVALAGSFAEEFLNVPQEALISSMREHQKYFHLVDHEGNLLPKFITIANIESVNPATVISGNERVIRPRLSDAAFFFETDKQTPLAARTERLAGVVFQHKLGSLADKQQRMVGLTEQLSESLGADPVAATRAAALAKCDLVSDMVLEFPELQGIAGAHYAKNDGEPAQVVTAIEQHYWPKQAGDALPSTPEAAAVALADRLDTLAGIFGIGQTPTGSKDPFGLRRAALAVLRILIERGHDLDLRQLAEQAVASYPSGSLDKNTAAAVTDYSLERLRALYEDQSIGVDVLRAVTATGLTAPSEIDKRVQALQVFAKTEAAEALAAANKRVANILAKSENPVSGEPDPALFTEAAEAQLFDALTGAKQQMAPKLETGDYAAALAVLSELRQPIDSFFDQVMVNAEDPAQKLNRYRLLAALRALFISIADIAQLSYGNG